MDLQKVHGRWALPYSGFGQIFGLSMSLMLTDQATANHHAESRGGRNEGESLESIGGGGVTEGQRRNTASLSFALANAAARPRLDRYLGKVCANDAAVTIGC